MARAPGLTTRRSPPPRPTVPARRLACVDHGCRGSRDGGRCPPFDAWPRACRFPHVGVEPMSGSLAARLPTTVRGPAGYRQCRPAGGCRRALRCRHGARTAAATAGKPRTALGAAIGRVAGCGHAEHVLAGARPAAGVQPSRPAWRDHRDGRPDPAPARRRGCRCAGARACSPERASSPIDRGYGQPAAHAAVRSAIPAGASSHPRARGTSRGHVGNSSVRPRCRPCRAAGCLRA